MRTKGQEAFWQSDRWGMKWYESWVYSHHQSNSNKYILHSTYQTSTAAYSATIYLPWAFEGIKVKWIIINNNKILEVIVPIYKLSIFVICMVLALSQLYLVYRYDIGTYTLWPNIQCYSYMVPMNYVWRTLMGLPKHREVRGLSPYCYTP